MPEQLSPDNSGETYSSPKERTSISAIAKRAVAGVVRYFEPDLEPPRKQEVKLVGDKYVSDGPAYWHYVPEVDWVGIDPEFDTPELKEYVTGGGLLADLRRTNKNKSDIETS